MTTIYKTYTTKAEINKNDAADGIYSAWVTTEEVDRDGDIIRAGGIDTTAYQRNSIVLFGHDYKAPPVAKTLFLEKIPGQGMKANFQFPPWGASARADEVHALWHNGFLNATSIGFIPKRSSPRSGGTGMDYEEIELLEYSIVPVPANASATAVRAFKELGGVLAERAKFRTKLDGFDKRLSQIWITCKGEEADVALQLLRLVRLLKE